MPSMRPLWPPSTWLTPSIARPSSTPVRSPPSGPSKTPTSRCNDERGIRFVNQYGGERVYQLDAKELGLNDIKDSVSEYFNHLIFAPILNNVYMRALSVVTHKDYMTRRYMWKLDY